MLHCRCPWGEWGEVGPSPTEAPFRQEHGLHRRPIASAHAGLMWGGKTFHNGKWAGLGQERGSVGSGPPRAQLLISPQQEAQELQGGSPLACRGCRATSPGEGGELTGPLGHNSDTWPTSPTQHKPCPGNTTGGQPAPSSWPACGHFSEVSTGEPQLAG